MGLIVGLWKWMRFVNFVYCKINYAFILFFNLFWRNLSNILIVYFVNTIYARHCNCLFYAYIYTRCCNCLFVIVICSTLLVFPKFSLAIACTWHSSVKLVKWWQRLMLSNMIWLFLKSAHFVTLTLQSLLQNFLERLLNAMAWQGHGVLIQVHDFCPIES